MAATNAGNRALRGYISPLDPLLHPLPSARSILKSAAVAALATLFCAGIAQAQNAEEPEQGRAPGGREPARIPYWKVVLPGGAYVVRLDMIASVSLQRYVLDGAARVTELNITTPGVMQPRFYYIDVLPTSVPSAGVQAAIDQRQEEAAALARRVNPDDPLWTKVAKTYPTTTHAGTIEYRLETRAQLEQLYESVERAWISRRTETVTLSGAVDPGQTARDSQEDGGNE